MNRDSFVEKCENPEGFPGFTPGRQVFVVAIDSASARTEHFLRAALWDYFGSLNAGVRKVSPRPATDEVCPI